MKVKTKINKWDLIKSFCTTKETIKRQPSEWDKIFANWRKWQGINFQNIQCSSILKKNNWVKKWVEDLNRHFSKEDIQMANTHMKRCSTSLIIREMQIKTTIRYLILIRMATIKKSTHNKCRRGCEEKGSPLHCQWECKLVQSIWRTVWGFLQL